jgi:hypothetical protein
MMKETRKQASLLTYHTNDKELCPELKIPI